MATTIKSTALDFDNIKNNLKIYFASQDEFADYNFEASGLSNLLDVLAYNTHINGLTANFALNESFLGTAQLRSSIIGLAEQLGYIPNSRTSSVATINLSITFTAVSRPQKITLSSGQQFVTSVDGTTFVFYTQEDLEAVDDGSGNYVFKTAEGSADIEIYEGISRTKKFLVGQTEDNPVYVVPDTKLDLNTVSVKVFDSPSDTVYTTYTNITQAITLSSVTSLYVMRESPNGYFELTFGNGTALGTSPVAGNMVQVEYLASSGPEANGASAFTTSISLSGISDDDYTVDDVVTVNNSAGGAYKEGIESIRQNAPYQYASQNRMVTASDYSALVLQSYSSLISDIAAWGGQDNLVKEYGKVFMSILFNDDISDAVIASTKTKIQTLASQLSVMSFTLEFADPEITYLEIGVNFDFNSALTDLPLGTVQTSVKNATVDYFSDNLGKFEQVFRLSNMLTRVDDVSTAVLSSSATVKMQRRIEPVLSFSNNIDIRYPVPIKSPDNTNYVITSSSFQYEGTTCKVKNKLGTATLQIVNQSNNAVVVDGVGSYDATNGIVSLVGFAPDQILGGVNYLKISAVPANINTIAPTNNEVLYQDVDASAAVGTIV